jgi:hypothetical protein
MNPMIKHNVLAAAVAAGLLAPASPVSAHHSVFATVDPNASVEVRAVLTKVDWINPHVWLHVDATTADGTVLKNVMIETLGAGGLRRIGISGAAMLKAGDVVTVAYYPNRNGEPGGFLNKIVLRDGTAFDTRPRSTRRG